MAEEECGDSSVVNMSSSSNWWENIHGGGGESWAWQNHGRNPSSGSPTCEDDVSISNSYNTNTSIHSGLSSVELSHRLLEQAAPELMLGEHMSDNQLWSRHTLLGMANNGEIYVDSSSSSKSMSSYFTGSGGGHHHNDGLIMPPLRTNLVKDWSIAPPVSEVDYLSLDSSSGLFPSDAYHKQYGDIKAECELGYGGFQDNSRYRYGRYEDDPVFADGSLSQKGTPGQRHRAVNKPGWKSSPLSYQGCKKQGAIPPLPASSSSSSVKANSVKGQASANGESKKKKASEDSPESTGVTKKHKHDSSSTSAARMQVTKAKLGNRIPTLQQIVSPFGKTDTASVLSETVGYIKFLQEQVGLLVSNPYMKANPHKDLWGGIERKERVDTRVVELRSKGLCLVPVSCTPLVYRDNKGSDYWTPPYRSLLYR
ncbi:hypothetical protein MLD38_003827 [Melastoma candidum]|uniref:Uncharacterized protein n=1 Tax=Melastoma candidum TaxID=119954 RepID=A0ACB9S6Z4_9MYRT|nr:hypothetical protein MLD38_003827 [Melastoma candidum]